MKNVIVSFFLIFVLILTSCTSSKQNSYDVKITASIENSVFKDSVEVFQINDMSTQKFDNPVECNFKVGKKDVLADLILKKDYAHKSRENVYLSKDKNTEYVKSIDHNSFTIKSQKDTVLSSFKNEILTEQNLKNCVNDFLSSYIDINALNNYNYSCTTSVITTTSTAAWKETKDIFYLPQNDAEMVISYKIEYRKYFQNIATSDCVVVICNSYGEITACYYYEYDVDWGNSTFDNAIMHECVANYLEENISSEYYLIDYKIDSQQLIYVDEEIQLAVSVELTLEKNNEEVVVLCPLILSHT